MGSYQQQQLYTQLASFNSNLNSGLSIQPVGSGDTIGYVFYPYHCRQFLSSVWVKINISG